MSTPRNNVVDLKLKQKMAAAPPSPVPTGKGSRTAGNQIFSEYLDKELTVPLLVLQPPHPDDHDHRNVIDHVEISSDDIAYFLDLPQINYASLESGDGSDHALDLAAAPFQITSHGISSQELQWLVKQADQLILPEDNVPVPGKIITCVWSADGRRLEWGPSHVIADQTNPYLLEKFERIASKLHKIGQKLCKLSADSKDETEFGKWIQQEDCAISMYRNNTKNNTTLLRNEERSINAVDDHHHSMYFHLYPDAGPDTIVVSLGKHKDQELMRLGRQRGSRCFFIELKYCRVLSSDQDTNYSTISIRDQIMAALIFLYIYRLYAFFFL